MNLKSKLAAVLFVASLILASIACGSEASPTSAPIIKTATPETSSQGEPTKASETQPAETQEPKPTETAALTEIPQPTETYLGDIVVQSDYFISAVQVEDPATPGLLYQAEAGKRLVAVEIIVGNLSGTKLSVNPLNTTLLDSEGFTYQADLGARDGQISTLELGAGEKLRGWIAFQIPEAAQLASLKFATSLFGGEDLKVGLLPPPAGYTPLTADIARRAPQLAKLGDVVEVGGYSLSAVTVEDPAKPGLIYQPEKGTRLVAVEIVVGNVSGPELSVNPLYVVLVDSEGFLYEAELAGRDGQIDTVKINSGEKVKGWVAFQVPENATLESIKFAPLFSDLAIQTGLTQ